MSITIKNAIKDKLYLWESTSSGKNNNDTVLDTENNKSIFGVQIRDLENVIDKYDKHELSEHQKTMSNDINVNINVVQDHANTLREAIRETLSDVDPNLAIEFLERLNLKMKEIKYTEETGLIPLKS